MRDVTAMSSRARRSIRAEAAPLTQTRITSGRRQRSSLRPGLHPGEGSAPHSDPDATAFAMLTARVNNSRPVHAFLIEPVFPRFKSGEIDDSTESRSRDIVTSFPLKIYPRRKKSQFGYKGLPRGRWSEIFLLFFRLIISRLQYCAFEFQC